MRKTSIDEHRSLEKIDNEKHPSQPPRCPLTRLDKPNVSQYPLRPTPIYPPNPQKLFTPLSVMVNKRTIEQPTSNTLTYFSDNDNFSHPFRPLHNSHDERVSLKPVGNIADKENNGLAVPELKCEPTPLQIGTIAPLQNTLLSPFPYNPIMMSPSTSNTQVSLLVNLVVK